MNTRPTRPLAAATLTACMLSPLTASALDLPARGDASRHALEVRTGQASVAIPGVWSRPSTLEGAAHASLYLTPELTYRWGARALTPKLGLDWRAVDLDGFALRLHSAAGLTALFVPSQLAADADLAIMFDWGGDDGLAFSMGPHARGATLLGPPNTGRMDLGAAFALGLDLPGPKPGRAWLRAETGYRLGGAGLGALYADVGLAVTFR